MEFQHVVTLPVRGEEVKINATVEWYSSKGKRQDKQGLVQVGSVTIEIEYEDLKDSRTHYFKALPGSPPVTLEEVISKLPELCGSFRPLFLNHFQKWEEIDSSDGGNWGYFGNNDM